MKYIEIKRKILEDLLSQEEVSSMDDEEVENFFIKIGDEENYYINELNAHIRLLNGGSLDE